MKPLLTTILAGALVAGCVGHARADHALAREDIQPGAEPQVFDIDRHNLDMKRAVHKARHTVGVFIHALQNPAAGQTDFEVKKPFRQGDTVEHMWLSGVTFSGNRFHGYVDNQPRKIKGLKMGDRVSVDPNEISDWAFIDKGRLTGGYTIQVLYAGLTPQQRQALEQEARFTIASHH